MELEEQGVYWVAVPVEYRKGRKQCWVQKGFTPQCSSDTWDRKERGKEPGFGRECSEHEADLAKS